ncbi:MAG TPA: TonB-dependent receptor [Thermoanaerobaculia bacterium]|nr:TonB-dependent receptor [Thermoanaerobaculia bacterium]
MIDRISCTWAAWLLASLMFLGPPSLVPAQAQPAGGPQAGAITGAVISEAGPVEDAVVRIVELRRQTRVEGDGTFRFEGVPAGTWLLEATSSSAGAAVERAVVPAGGTAQVFFALDLTVHREEIVVTASPDVRSTYEIAQPTSVLSGEELQRRIQPTLGETLSREPGVTSTFFGQGASRPVIRGLGGDRIRVLESGIGSGDASTTSPDHAVSLDPLAAERIEVLRGPATLLYGSSAVGGVVNVIDERIPDSLPDQRVSGTVELRGGSVADERGGIASFNGSLGRIAWHADYLRRETDDYEIPGFAESEILRGLEGDEGEGEEEEAFRVMPNSATETETGTVGLSWIANDGFLGVSVRDFDTLYGIPGGHHQVEGESEGEEPGEAEEAAVRVDLEQRRYDLRGGLNRPFGIFRGASLRFGSTDYEHRELEGAEVGTRFLNDSWEGRLELLQKQLGSLTGSFGLQALSRDFEAIGEEAFVPPTQTDSWAAFTFQEIARGGWRFQLGARFESQDVSAETEGIDDRSFDGLSGSFGVVRRFGENYSLGLSIARSTKLPNAEELFSNGPHIATNAFEIGNPNLEEETSLGADLTLRKVSGRLTGEVTLFANRFDDYIYESFTDEEEDGLPVFRYVQQDAEFRGAELTGVWAAWHREPYHFDVEFGADFVRAELRDSGDPLPRIPPRRYRLGVHYRGERLDGLVEGVRVDEQDRVAAFELPTGGYTLVNASLGYRFFTTRVVYDVLLRGTNLTNEEARNHVSFLKDLVPLPGRDVSLALRVTF